MDTVFLHFITQHSLIQPGDTVIIGLSGGPDSVCLLHMLNALKKQLNITLIAAHLNHGWRLDAENDLLLCQNLCKTLNIPFESIHASNLAITLDPKKSLEEQGRLMRRFYFNTLKQKYNATSIALGHHSDDQIETFFIRLIRGASIEGLGSIRPKKDEYIRPLLPFSKKNIVEYLTNHNLSYCTDSTNQSPLFLRNRLRTIIPQLTDCDRRFEQNTLKAIYHLQESYNTMQLLMAEKIAYIIDFCNTSALLDVKLFITVLPIIQKEIVIKWLIHEKVPFTPSAAFINEIIRFLKNHRGGTHYIHKKSWAIIKKKNKASIKKLHTNDTSK